MDTQTQIIVAGELVTQGLSVSAIACPCKKNEQAHIETIEDFLHDSSRRLQIQGIDIG